MGESSTFQNLYHRAAHKDANVAACVHIFQHLRYMTACCASDATSQQQSAKEKGGQSLQGWKAKQRACDGFQRSK
eukprot:scaffold196814_cov19-Tisochrysis_lutea.AAC.2